MYFGVGILNHLSLIRSKNFESCWYFIYIKNQIHKIHFIISLYEFNLAPMEEEVEKLQLLDPEE